MGALAGRAVLYGGHQQLLLQMVPPLWQSAIGYSSVFHVSIRRNHLKDYLTYILLDFIPRISYRSEVGLKALFLEVPRFCWYESGIREQLWECIILKISLKSSQMKETQILLQKALEVIGSLLKFSGRRGRGMGYTSTIPCSANLQKNF